MLRYMPSDTCYPPVQQWDKEWITRSDAEFRMWEGDSQELFGGCTLYRFHATSWGCGELLAVTHTCVTVIMHRIVGRITLSISVFQQNLHGTP